MKWNYTQDCELSAWIDKNSKSQRLSIDILAKLFKDSKFKKFDHTLIRQRLIQI